MCRIVDLGCNNRIQCVAHKWQTETNSHTDLIVLFGEVCQNDSLDCEKGLTTYAEPCPDDVNDPFVPRNHELEDDS